MLSGADICIGLNSLSLSASNLNGKLINHDGCLVRWLKSDLVFNLPPSPW